MGSGVEPCYDKIKISCCEGSASKTIIRVNLIADKADLTPNHYL
ncbi:hypothetical protein [uncultured Campylobacter sp.]|nr:hypothetical protein [uncultured Campylobacter sp.]